MTTTAPPTPPTSSPTTSTDALPRFAWAPVTVTATITTGVLLALGGRYGVHRDEFYYLAGGRHLAWGFVDHPPLTPLLARVQADVFGTSAGAFRILPSLAAGFAVVMTALIARELGGRRHAQVLAAIGAALLPAIRGPHFLFGTTSMDQVFWAVLIFLAVRMVRTRDTRWWIAIGAVAGVGLLNKHTVLFALVMIVGGLLCTSDRALLANRWALLGGALAALVWLPNIMWQWSNGLPVFEMSASIRENNGGVLGGLPDFALESIALWAVAGVLIAWWGWRWLLRDAEGRPWRALGVGAALVVPLVALGGGKAYYAAPIALVLLPAACVAVQDDRARRRGFTGLLLLSTIPALTFTLPLLPADRLDAVTPLNQEFSEMVGWTDLADQVAAVYDDLSLEEKRRAVIFTGDYGEAGALELYEPERRLPVVYSGHNSYADWGVPPESADVVIVVGIAPERLDWCDAVDPVTTITNRAGIDNSERGQAIAVCRGLTEAWLDLWPSLVHVN
jgi:hypothetical protein